MDPERACEPCKEMTWASIRASESRILENSMIEFTLRASLVACRIASCNKRCQENKGVP